MRANVPLATVVMLLVASVARTPAHAGPNPSLLPRPGLQPLQTTALPAPSGAIGEPAAPKSIYKAAMLSALLPGLGEAYSGHSTRALISGSAEAAIWISYATFEVQEDLRGDRAIEYAVSYAGAAGGGDDDYYKAVGQFERADGPGMWNEYVRRKARDEGEVVGREYTGSEAWAWTSSDRYAEYRQLRHDKLTASDHATNALAFAIVNRVISVVSVVQAVRSDHRRAREQFGLRFDAGPSLGAPQARVGLWNRF